MRNYGLMLGGFSPKQKLVYNFWLNKAIDLRLSGYILTVIVIWLTEDEWPWVQGQGHRGQNVIFKNVLKSKFWHLQLVSNAS